MITPGQILGQYHILDKLGEGGMGAVYKAEQPAIKRVVVVKVLSANVADNRDMLERFKRELDIIARLEHPHILPVYDFGEFEGSPYIVMRYMGGGSLLDRLQARNLSREELLRAFDQIAQALEYAHERTIIHRDLKPANVLLDESGNAYLADFGLAKALEGSQELTKTGSILGTPAYMSPEQARGDKLDQRSDVYSLAIMAYEALAGQQPFQGKSTWDLIRLQITATPPSIVSINPELPFEVESVINAALSKNPADRPATVVEFVRALRTALASADSEGLAGTASSAYPSTRAAVAPLTAAQSRAASMRSARASAAPVAPASAAAARSQAAASAPAIPRSAAIAVPAVLLLVLIGGVAVVAVLGIGAYIFRDKLFPPSAATYAVGDSPRAVLTDGSALWVANGFDNSVTQLQATNCTATADSCGQALATYPVDELPVAIVEADGKLWVASALNSKLTALDKTSGATLLQVDLPNVPTAMIGTSDALWIANQFGNTVTKVDFAGNVVADFSVSGGPVALAFLDGIIWVATPANNEVVGITPADGTVVASVALEGQPVALVATTDYVWAAIADKNQVVAIESQYQSVHSTLNVGASPVALMFDGQRVWSANQGDNTLSKIDPKSFSVTSTVKLSAKPYALAASTCGDACRDIWVASEASDSVLRVRVP